MTYAGKGGLAGGPPWVQPLAGPDKGRAAPLRSRRAGMAPAQAAVRAAGKGGPAISQTFW